MRRDHKILIVGHNDIIENSLCDYFKRNGFNSILSFSQSNIDALNQSAVLQYFEKFKPDYVFLGSVRSGGIAANQKFAAEFIYENLESQNNIIHSSYKTGVKKLLFFAGSCVYPKETHQPIKEEYLLTGPVEETSEPYSVAKIAGIKLCQSYRKQYGFNAIVAIPATIYGSGSDTELETAHVMGALIGKFVSAVKQNAKEVTIWGSGRPQREFLYVDDFIDACIVLMEKYEDSGIINVGCGVDISIKELANVIKELSGFQGKIVFDVAKPDGTMKKLMDNSKITKLGWRAQIELKEGIKRTLDWYTKEQR